MRSTRAHSLPAGGGSLKRLVPITCSVASRSKEYTTLSQSPRQSDRGDEHPAQGSADSRDRDAGALAGGGDGDQAQDERDQQHDPAERHDAGCARQEDAEPGEPHRDDAQGVALRHRTRPGRGLRPSSRGSRVAVRSRPGVLVAGRRTRPGGVVRTRHALENFTLPARRVGRGRERCARAIPLVAVRVSDRRNSGQ